MSIAQELRKKRFEFEYTKTSEENENIMRKWISSTKENLNKTRTLKKSYKLFTTTFDGAAKLVAELQLAGELDAELLLWFTGVFFGDLLLVGDTTVVGVFLLFSAGDEMALITNFFGVEVELICEEWAPDTFKAIRSCKWKFNLIQSTISKKIWEFNPENYLKRKQVFST